MCCECSPKKQNNKNNPYIPRNSTHLTCKLKRPSREEGLRSQRSLDSFYFTTVILKRQTCVSGISYLVVLSWGRDVFSALSPAGVLCWGYYSPFQLVPRLHFPPFFPRAHCLPQWEQISQSCLHCALPRIRVLLSEEVLCRLAISAMPVPLPSAPLDFLLWHKDHYAWGSSQQVCM